jgi:hypothetical protein
MKDLSGDMSTTSYILKISDTIDVVEARIKSLGKFYLSTYLSLYQTNITQISLSKYIYFNRSTYHYLTIISI